jgi:glucokinase
MQGLDNRALPVLAVDIGGTKIMTAVFSDGGRMLAKEVCPTLADEGLEAVIERLFSAIDGLLSQNNMVSSQLVGIGIAAAGIIDSGRGLITVSPNLPGWHDVPLKKIVAEKYSVDTFLLNDACGAALGEHRFGAGRGVSNLVLLTLGTGIGGGIIINGELYEGASGSAGEIGHMIIDVNGPECACGNRGCLEALASGVAIAGDAVNRIKKGEKSSLVEMVRGEIEGITAEQVGAAARGGDSLAMEVISQAAGYLGMAMVNLVNIFNPEMIILGGGMVELGALFVDPAKKIAAEKAFRVSAQAVDIVTAQLGNEAGVYGAAAYVLKQGTRRIA